MIKINLIKSKVAAALPEVGVHEFSSEKEGRGPSSTDILLLKNLIIICIFPAALYFYQSQVESQLTYQKRKVSNEQNRIQQELIQKKQFKTQKRWEQTNKLLTALHQTLSLIHKANSISELEFILSESLRAAFHLEFVKISTELNSIALEENLKKSKFVFLKEDMKGSSSNPFGSLFYCRKEKNFNRQERELLSQVTESAFLNIERILQIQRAETLKQQWETTFNAIEDPICICNKGWEITHHNKSFEKLLPPKSSQEDIDSEPTPSRNILSFSPPSSSKLTNSYRVTTLFEQLPKIQWPKSLFSKVIDKKNISESNPEELKISKLTDLENGKEIRFLQESLANEYFSDLEILITTISIDEDELLRVVFFHDVSEQKKMERQLLESSKMADLGIISSSIAHELNNPLSGILSFLQLIKMDLSNKEAIYEDILEMITSAQRCKEIIENLLGFSRQSESNSLENFHIKQAVEKSLKLIELRSRSIGISISQHILEDPQLIGNLNNFSQALKNLLQNSVEAIEEKIKQNPRYPGKISINLTQNRQQNVLTIVDNGVGISNTQLSKIFNPLYSSKKMNNNSGLGLTIAFQIIKEHHGTLEIFSQPDEGCTAKITF